MKNLKTRLMLLMCGTCFALITFFASDASSSVSCYQYGDSWYSSKRDEAGLVCRKNGVEQGINNICASGNSYCVEAFCEIWRDECTQGRSTPPPVDPPDLP
jgi:hypothetical protein